MKRAALYFFYDQEGIVDAYNFYLLEDLKKSLGKLYVVVNGALAETSRARFLEIADDVYVRSNTGYDVWAYKEGMEHIGWDVIQSFDEFILMNFTSYGPVYPFAEMFAAMDRRPELDFWGITKHNGHDYDPYQACKYGYIPAHIQSSFIAIRKSMLCSPQYRSYWEEMPIITGYVDSICRHEAVFTKHFADLGFQSDVYVNTDDLKDVTDYPLMLMPVELVKNRRCPVFKRKMFMNIYEEYMDITCGQPAVEFLEYLKQETDYPLDFIWDNLLRTSNMWDIKQRLQLNYILPREVAKPLPRQPKTALFLHLYYMDGLKEAYHYAEATPEYADLYFTTNTQEKAEEIARYMEPLGRRTTVVVVENRGREYAGFFIGLREYVKDYEYIGIAHGKKSRYEKPYIIGDSFAYHCFENTLASQAYVSNVLATFEENPRLGLLVPPTPSHAMYYTTIGREWRGNYPAMVQLLKDWQIKAPTDPTKPPVAPLGGFFWFRSKALQSLFDREFTYDMFPEEPCTAVDGTIMHVLERIYPFVAQDAGFYSAWVMSDRYAAMQLTNQYKTIRDINEYVFWSYGECNRHGELYHLQRAIAAEQQQNTCWKRRMVVKIKKLIGPRGCALYRKIFKRRKGMQ